jgi:hypothetical protein
MFSEDPFISAPQIENCYNYEIFQEAFAFKEFRIGYILSVTITILC